MILSNEVPPQADEAWSALGLLTVVERNPGRYALCDVKSRSWTHNGVVGRRLASGTPIDRSPTSETRRACSLDDEEHGTVESEFQAGQVGGQRFRHDVLAVRGLLVAIVTRNGSGSPTAVRVSARRQKSARLGALRQGYAAQSSMSRRRSNGPERASSSLCGETLQ